MPIVEHTVTIRAPQGVVWHAASENAAIRRLWDPFIIKSQLLDGALAAVVGAKNRVTAYNGFSMTVQYVTYKPQTLMAMKMIEGPRLFEQFAGSWNFKIVDEGTQVTFRYLFKTRWLSAVLDPVIQRIFTRDVRNRLDGLRTYCESPAARSANAGQPQRTSR
jgi:ribosome-associated toxin RatA of RatAB toxin-antitoxin module